jgi:hypothetical protein
MHDFYALFSYVPALEHNKYTQNIVNINALENGTDERFAVHRRGRLKSQAVSFFILYLIKKRVKKLAKMFGCLQDFLYICI